QWRAAGLRCLGLFFAADRGKVRKIEDGSDRIAKPIGGLPGVGRAVIVAPSHDAVRPNKESPGFLDFADTLPFAIEVLCFGGAGHDDPEERKIEPLDRILPNRPGKTG